MLAVLFGSLALLAGLALLLEPLLLPELSRPRDALWAGVVLLLGLVLVTAAERLQGAPMLGVLCGGLLVGRLGSEVGQQRWAQLPPEDRLELRTLAHWQRRGLDLAVAVSRAVGLAGALLVWVAQRSRRPALTKRWVRADLPPAQESAPHPEPEPGPEARPAPEDRAEPQQGPDHTPSVESHSPVDPNTVDPSVESDDQPASVDDKDWQAQPALGDLDIIDADIIEFDVIDSDAIDPEVIPADREEEVGADPDEAPPVPVRMIADLDEVDALLDAADG